MVLIPLLVLCFSLLVLVKSSDYFVESAARIAKYLGISELAIGLTIIAIGTSLPELGSSAMASLAGQTELAVGTVVGSNIANIGLILGLSALIIVLKMDKKVLLRDCSVMLYVSLLFYVFAYDGTVTTLEGAILLAIVPLYLTYLFHFRPKLSRSVYDLKGYVERVYIFGSHGLRQIGHVRSYEKFFNRVVDGESYRAVFAGEVKKDLLVILVTVVLIYVSSKYLVQFAVEIAQALGVTENIIGATLIAVGTSLPELSVSISSIRKGFVNILLGNLIGSNIFNIILVAGLAAVISPLNILSSTLLISLPFMLLTAILLFAFVRTEQSIKWRTGISLLAIYGLFVYLLVGSGAAF